MLAAGKESQLPVDISDIRFMNGKSFPVALQDWMMAGAAPTDRCAKARCAFAASFTIQFLKLQ